MIARPAGPSNVQVASAASVVRAGYRGRGRIAVRAHSSELFKVGVRVDESRGKRGGSDTPFGRVTWIPV